MLIRRVNRADIPQISRLYYETVQRVNARDYNPAQIHAWAPRVYPDNFWQRRLPPGEHAGKKYPVPISDYATANTAAPTAYSGIQLPVVSVLL